MKKLTYPTLTIGLISALITTFNQSYAAEPLKQPGKTTLYQRILTTPLCQLKTKLTDTIGENIPAFSRYYIYDRKTENNIEWLNVGPDAYGKTTGWLNNQCVINWNMQLSLVFTNPVDRDALLFFKEKNTLEAIIASEDPAQAIKPIRSKLAKNQTTNDVLAQEPKEYIDFKQNFYLLPILQGEEVMNSQGFYQRLLQVASVSKQNKFSLNQSVNKPLQQVIPFKAAIVFVIDSTISMQPYINRSREAIARVYQQIEKQGLQDQVRFGLVSFRSSLKASSKLEFVSKIFVDPNETSNSKDFHKSAEKLSQATVSTAYFAEDAYAGINTALDDIDWHSFGARYLILITDASAIPGDDPYSSTGLDAPQLRLEAEHKGVAIYTLHLKTEAGSKDHQTAQKQYSELSYNNFINKPLYYSVDAGNVQEFGKKIDILAESLASQVKLAYQGENAIGSAENAKDDIVKDLLLLGKAMQLAYLGDIKGTKAPTVFKAWISDRDFVKPTVATAEPRILLTKSQLSDLNDIVSKIANAANDGLISSNDMFTQLRSIAATMGQDPNKLKSTDSIKIADLGLLGEYLDDIPYKSEITSLDEDTWKSMSGLEQEKFIRNLHSKIRYYQKCNADVDRWISLSDGSDVRENVYPIPLEMLP